MSSSERPRARLEPLVEGDDPVNGRVRAALLLRAGGIPEPALAQWREAVRAGEFEPDACAAALIEQAAGRSPREALTRASAALLRDLVMAPVAARDGRRARLRAKSGAALLVSQAYLLLVWGGLTLAAVLLLRMRGASVDAFLDSLLGTFH